MVIDYPINVGGRPLHAWPAFIVLAFEAGILGAALAGFFGLLAANGLPEYHHPVFERAGLRFREGGGFWLLLVATTRRRPTGPPSELRASGRRRVEEVAA